MDQARLVDDLRRGDPGAFSALVDQYGGRHYNFAARMCRNDEDAKDVLQDTLLAAARSVAGFRAEGALSTWLFRIAVNACRKMHRRGKFEPYRHLSLDEFLPSESEAAVSLSARQETPETVLARTDLRGALEDGIALLPRAYRAVLILRDLEGLSTQETAEALGLTPVAVKVRLHRARLFLRQRLVTERPGETKRSRLDQTE
jgi:RNA polymerase sigma-70 factor (ECF subfamily)